MLHTYSINMANLKKAPIAKETIVLSEEEQMKQAHLKGYISSLTDELVKARSKEELLDMLKWFTKRTENY